MTGHQHNWYLVMPRTMLAAAVIACCLAGGPARGEEPAAAGKTDADQKWKPLIDCDQLGQWQPLTGLEFGDKAEVSVDEGILLLKAGDPATGVRWKGKFPRSDYELTLEAQRVEGGDFFCGLTMPLPKGEATLILGGWGGWVVGLSCIDGQYAVDNQTCQAIPFELNQWYHVRAQVHDKKIQIWVDDKQIIDLQTDKYRFAASQEMQPCAPLGIATWRTTGAIRKMRYRELDAAAPE